jgi:hypothetical protein
MPRTSRRKSESGMPAICRKALLKALAEPKPLSIATCRMLSLPLIEQAGAEGQLQPSPTETGTKPNPIAPRIP